MGSDTFVSDGQPYNQHKMTNTPLHLCLSRQGQLPSSLKLPASHCCKALYYLGYPSSLAGAQHHLSTSRA